MIRLTRFAAVLLALSLCASAFATPRTFPKKEGGPDVTFESDSVRAAGATPNAVIHFAAVALSSSNYELRVHDIAGTATAGADGVAQFATPVHERSVWLVVDPQRGYTVCAPPGMLLREMSFPGSGVQNNSAGQLRRLLVNRFHLDVFLVRPGAGIWSGYLKDGAENDEDGIADGSTSADLNALKPVVPAAGALERLEQGDVLFLVDRNTLEFHVFRRGQP